MKNLGFLALGLLCGIVLPFGTQAYEDGIYTGLVDENGSGVITVIFGGNDTFSGVKITLKAEDQLGRYYRGFNKPKTESYSFSKLDRGCTGTYLSGDGKLAGCTNGVNDVWGGSGDNKANNYIPTPSEESKAARRGPCDTGYHIPSKGEWNYLIIAWCNLDDSCHARYSYPPIEGLATGDFKKGYDWTESNNTVIIDRFPLGTNFRAIFNLFSGFYRSSSIDPSSPYYAWNLRIFPEEVYVTSDYRVNPDYIRCFKNSIVAPAPLTVILTFLSGDVQVWSGVAISGGVYTGDVPGTGSENPLPNMTKEGYKFDGWFLSGAEKAFDFSGTAITGNLELYAKWTHIVYTINFNTDGGTEIADITGYYNDDITAPQDPTKAGYTFSGWDRELVTKMPAENTGYKALWAENKKSSGSSGGGGRGSSKTSDIQDSSTSSQNNKNTKNVIQSETKGSEESSNTPMDSSDKSSEGQEILSPSDSSFTKEQKDAYEFAHEKGITTMPTIQEAQMNGKLTRIAMAKMLSQYAINVLLQKPANIITPKFNDVTDKQNSDYDDGITLAYQLGIMGQNMPNNNFRPNDEVTRAEFATALSRMAYGTSDGEYKGTGKYYIHHMEKLVKEGIITNDDAKMKELRGYVMIMLMRSAK